MKRTTQILALTVLSVVFVGQMAFAQLHLDPDTGKYIKDGYDISVFVQLPTGQYPCHMAYGKGGTFGTDLYVAAGKSGNIYRVNSTGQASLFATLPTGINSVAFPNPGSGFGDYMYAGSPDGYYLGNKNIYRVDGSASATVFFDGTNFLGGTTNAISFAPSGSPYGNYLFTHDDNPDQIYLIASDGTKTTFSSGIPLAMDFVFDTYGRFDNQLLVVNKEKSEHGSGYDTVYKAATNGTKTTLLGNVFHMGGGDITDPSSAFAGKMFLVENYWPSPPTDLYAVSPDGTYEVFAQGFQYSDFQDVIYGPDGALYTGDESGTIYKITPEPATLGLLLLGGLALLRRRREA